jgi:eukaryotic-like serine/threonine-protein kinase
MPATRSLFRSSALLSGLVTEEQFEQASLTAGILEDGPPAPAVEVSDIQIAARLVEMAVLTTYQAEQIKTGRTKFTLGPYWTVTDFIGQGGMGRVYKGMHSVMGRECAIKVLPLEKATPEAIANFTREIRTQAQLDHPNLVRAYDAGRDGNVHYLVVEYVPGVDLRKLVRREGKLSQQQAASLILQAARGLDYAHRQGLVHRDIKPGNILVTLDGKAKVSDLGLAGFIHDAANDPRSGKIVGTADYLAPEQISNPGESSHLIDIYSLGCTLYYACCGKVPFPGGAPAEKARKHLHDTPWHPRRFNPDLSEEFVEVIADMMDKDPKARIQSAAEVAARLEQFAGDPALIASGQSFRSPWSAAPVPSGDDEREVLQDTDEGDYSASSADASVSQMSQGTSPVASAETTAMRTSRARSTAASPPAPPVLTPTALVALTLMIAVPLSMLVGALVAALAFWVWQ